MTRRLFLVLALMALAAATFLTQGTQPSPGVGIIQGTVVREGTSDPIPEVQITVLGRGGMNLQTAQTLINEVNSGVLRVPPEMLQQAQETVRGGQQPTAVSDSAGQFIIRNVPAGRQIIQAQLEGYFGPGVNGNYPSLIQTPVTVKANETVTAKVSLLPGGTISGRVLDSTGKLMSDATVEVLRPSYQNGVTSWVAYSIKSTDDRGEYRLYRLPPGEYYLGVSPRLRSLPNAPASTLTEIPVWTYYPGTTDANAASVVDLKAGDELGGINIQLRSAIAAKISGRVISSIPAGSLVGARGQARPPAGFVTLVPRERKGIDRSTSSDSATANPSDSTYEITNVAPGIYDLIARFPIETLTGWGPGNAPGFATNPWAFGKATVEVRGANVDNVDIVIHKGTDIKGQLVIDGKPSAANVRITLQPDDAATNANDGPTSNTFSFISNYAAPIAEDGSFSLPLIPEGHYRFQVGLTAAPLNPARGAQTAAAAAANLPALPQNAYVADIRQGGVSVYDNGLTVGAQVNPIDILINTSPGSLEGIVSTADKKPIAVGTTVVLVPAENRRQNPALYKTGRTDQQGHFSVAGISPGSYTAFAWEFVPSGAWQNAGFLAKYAGRGTPVIIEAGAKATANVTLIEK